MSDRLDSPCWVMSPGDREVEYSIYICGSRKLGRSDWQSRVISRIGSFPVGIYATGLGRRVSFSEFITWREKVIRKVDGIFCWISGDSDWCDFLELGSILRGVKQLWVGVDFELLNFEFVAKAIQEARPDNYIFTDIQVAIDHAYRYYSGELETTQVIGVKP